MAAHNLPTFPTPFIGRADEIAELSQLLDDPNCRLLTLVGPGGIGKTRLAVEVARCKIDAFPNGVYFVPLQPLNDAQGIPTAITDAFNIHVEARQPLADQLLAYLHDRHLLLVLDNFEHLLEGAAFVAQLLQAAPHVKLLVTSREALNLQGEWRRDVAGMPYPDRPAADLEAYSALQLFAQRARRLRRNFDLVDNIAPVLRICRLVGGMPLGIELATAWLKTLPLERIIAEIERNLDFLSAQARDVPDRHRSLRAVFDYSWASLTAEEQAVFARLAVFRGGFTVAAAEAVAGASLWVLNGLVDKSLITLNESGRYDLHELLRQYAEERLGEGALAELQAAHAAYFSATMFEWGLDIKGRDQVAGLRAVEADLDNLRAAWVWAANHRHYGLLEPMIEGFFWFRNHRSRAHDVFREAWERLKPPAGADPHPVAVKMQVRIQEHQQAPRAVVERALAVARAHEDIPEIAFCAVQWGFQIGTVDRDFAAEEALYQAYLQRYRNVTEPFYIGEMMRKIGMGYGLTGQLDRGETLVREALSLWQASGSLVMANWARLALGEFDVQATGRGFQRFHQAWQIFEELGVPGGVAMARNFVSLGMLYNGDDLADVRRFVHETLALAESANHIESISQSLQLLSFLACLEEDYEVALEVVERSAAMTKGPWVRLDNTVMGMVACGLEDFDLARHHATTLIDQKWDWYHLIVAPLLARQGEAAWSVEVLGEADRHPWVRLFIHHWPLLQRLQADLEARLGSEAFAAAWARGHASDSEAMRQRLQAFFGEQDHEYPASQPLAEPLSDRELDVLRLVAEGYSNAEIADRLVIAKNTARKHVSNILGKLQVDNRTQAVAEARRLGLLP